MISAWAVLSANKRHSYHKWPMGIHLLTQVRVTPPLVSLAIPPSPGPSPSPAKGMNSDSQSRLEHIVHSYAVELKSVACWILHSFQPILRPNRPRERLSPNLPTIPWTPPTVILAIRISSDRFPGSATPILDQRRRVQHCPTPLITSKDLWTLSWCGQGVSDAKWLTPTRRCTTQR